MPLMPSDSRETGDAAPCRLRQPQTPPHSRRRLDSDMPPSYRSPAFAERDRGIELPNASANGARGQERGAALAGRGVQAEKGDEGEDVRLKEALADTVAELSDREEELLAAQQQVVELQRVLKKQSDELVEVRRREEELNRERSFLQEEAGVFSAGALQALEAQVSRQKATIVTLQEQLEVLADREDELVRCKEVIAELHRHKQEVGCVCDLG